MIKNRPLTKVHKPEQPPERCMICHSDTEQWYIDTGLDTTFDGTFYIGKCCVDKIVTNSPDHFTREQVTRLLHESTTLKNEAVDRKEVAHKEIALIKQKLIRIREIINE